jgi:hypothetical protein
MVQFPAVEYGRSSGLTLVMLMGRFSISRGVDVLIKHGIYIGCRAIVCCTYQEAPGKWVNSTLTLTSLAS